MFSVADLEQAWDRVEENGGCAGVDGVTVEMFGERETKELAKLAGLVESGDYRPYPLLKILVEKAPGNKKLRRLLVPAVRDRVLQTAAARRLSRSFEEEFLDSSFAYRPGRSVDRAVARVVQLRDRGFLYVVDADIQAYFDSVSHSRLLELLAAERPEEWLFSLVRGWVNAQVWDGSRVRSLTKGIPQGSPLSPLLANFFLTDFDVELQKSDYHLVRYADDFLILCESEEGARDALRMTDAWMQSAGLRLHHEKTRLTSFASGFKFLGVFFLGEHVFVPWKGERPQGRLVFQASPMPWRMLSAWERPRGRSAMEAAFAKVGRTVASPKEAKKRGQLVAHLYLTEQGAILRKSGERFLVEAGDRILLDLPYHKLETILLFGNIQITTQAMAELLEKGITLSLFSSQGRFRGNLIPPHGKDVRLRLAQFELYRNGEASLRMARAAIGGKIDNGLAVLRAYGTRAGGLGEIERELGAVESARAAVGPAGTLESLGGLEGTAAREYFGALMTFNRSGLEWPGRVKYPAKDPINSLLSLTYVLLLNELSALLEGLGVDPYVGFLHQPDFGRPSLALDLLELFRHPVADRFVLTLLNRKTITAEDFQPGQDRENAGLFLEPEAMRRYFALYERWMLARGADQAGAAERPSFRQALKREAEGFVTALRHGEEWASAIHLG